MPQKSDYEKGRDFARLVTGRPSVSEERRQQDITEERRRFRVTGEARKREVAIRAGELVPTAIPPGYEEPPAPVTAIPKNISKAMIEAREQGLEASWSEKTGMTIKTPKKEEVEPTGIENLTISDLRGILQSPQKYSSEMLERVRAELQSRVGLEVEEPTPSLLKYYGKKIGEKITPWPVRGEVEHRMPSGEVMPGVEHPGAVPGTTRPVGRIRVRIKATGQTGTIEPAEFDPKIYERIK